MKALRSLLDASSETSRANRAGNLERLDELERQQATATAGGGERYLERHRSRGRLLAALRGHLDPYKIPKAVIVVDAMPRTVGSCPMTIASTPDTTPMPVTTVAPTVNSVPHAARVESSRNGASRSSSSSMRSRTVSRPRARWRAA